MQKAFFALLAVTILLWMPSSAAAQSTTCALTIHVDGFRNLKGDLGITLFTSPDGWPENNNKAYFHHGFPITGTATSVTLQVPAGRYSIAVLHDENSNHKLDRNFLGIPKEGFGFANNPRAFLSPPHFSTAAVQVTCPSTETTIHLIYR
ncbi:MAG: DUF2141 domain-containing protein [Acidobacteriaceae bacterium]